MKFGTFDRRYFPAHMPRKKVQLEIVSRHGERAAQQPAPPTVSGRWILGALGTAMVAAVFCAWASLCLLFWQGAWQLLYYPTAKVTRTPAAAGMPFDAVDFDTTETGVARLHGWWIPAAAHAPASAYTVVYLHGATGNLGNCVNDLAAIHTAGVNILAFDYRGYGQSEFVHPSEARWRTDADSALRYVTGTRQVAVSRIVLAGEGLGANLALEVAAARPELVGVVLESPLAAPVNQVFNDARAQLVPAHLLFHDRYRMQAPAAALRIPSLWLFPASHADDGDSEQRLLAAYNLVTAPKTRIRLAGGDEGPDFARWLAGLHENHGSAD